MLWQHWRQLRLHRAGGYSGAYARTLVAELRHWRNAWAHQRLAREAVDDVWRAMDTAQRLLAELGAAGFAADIAQFLKPRVLAALQAKQAAAVAQNR